MLVNIPCMDAMGKGIAPKNTLISGLGIIVIYADIGTPWVPIAVERIEMSSEMPECEAIHKRVMFFSW